MAANLSLTSPSGIVGSFTAEMDSFERLLWWLFAGSTGAQTRFQVLDAIKNQPRNAQQLSQLLDLDYTTVRHHLRVLEQNRLVITEGDKYGKLYFLSDPMEANWQKLIEIIAKTGHSAKPGSDAVQEQGTNSKKSQEDLK
jgi:DNA-binding transcriptional ArsR family regulator